MRTDENLYKEIIDKLAFATDQNTKNVTVSIKKETIANKKNVLPPTLAPGWVLLLTCCLFQANIGYADTSQSAANTQQQAEAVRSVQNEVQTNVNQKITEQRKLIIQEAVTAVDETQRALNALNNNDPKAAIASLENAIGKLNIVLARAPQLALAPIHVSVTIRDLYTSPDTIKAIITDVRLALLKNDIQKARILMNWLASETVINVTSIPLATYPNAIKAIVPLIDQGKLEQAKTELQAALNTLVTTIHVIPMPYLRSIALLKRAESLSETANAQGTQKQEITNVFNAIRNQLAVAEILGYADASAHKAFNKQLNDIEKSIQKNEPVKNAFANAQRTLIDMLNKSSYLINYKYKTTVIKPST